MTNSLQRKGEIILTNCVYVLNVVHVKFVGFSFEREPSHKSLESEKMVNCFKVSSCVKREDVLWEKVMNLARQFGAQKEFLCVFMTCLWDLGLHLFG